MKVTKVFFILLLLAASMASCWREDLSKCWKNDVSLIFTAEKFQFEPEAESASDIAAMMDFVDFYLFKVQDNKMTPVDSGRVNKDMMKGDFFQVDFKELKFGDYVIAAVANNEKHFSNVKDTADLKVVYDTDNNRNDYYVAVKKFNVECYCQFSEFVKLFNTQGELEIRMNNLPENIIGAEITVDNVYETCKVDTTYYGKKKLTKYVESEPVDSEGDGNKETKNKFVGLDLFTFPTTNNELSPVTVKLFMKGFDGKPVIAKTYERDVYIPRNNTRRMKCDFNGAIVANPEWEITINPEWDGVNDSDQGVEI